MWRVVSQINPKTDQPYIFHEIYYQYNFPIWENKDYFSYIEKLIFVSHQANHTIK